MRNALLFALALLGASPCFGAGSYPSQPVHLIVPFPPGGTPDIGARVIAQQLSEQLGKPVVVENRGGASGIIGNGVVAKSARDGHTLMLCDPTISIIRSLFKSLPFDVLRDFTPITQVTRAPMVLVINPSLKSNTLKEFIALAQANPGSLNYGSAGVGTSMHLYPELFNIEPLPLTSAEVSARLKKEIAAWGPRIKAMKIEPR